MSKRTPAEIAARKITMKARRAIVREEKALAKMSPGLAAYWRGSCGRSVLDSLAAGEATVILAK